MKSFQHLSFALVIWLLAVLACGSPVSDLPFYICPTEIPPTATAVIPTLPPPTSFPWITPTATPVIWFPTATPWPTWTPIPTLTPTPYIVTPPQDFYIGDAIFVGSSAAPFHLRFRLQAVLTFPASAGDEGGIRSIYTWQLEVKNVGAAAFELFPALQNYISVIGSGSGLVEGQWGSTQAAGDEAGTAIDHDLYTLRAGESHTFQMAAYGPAGTAQKFVYVLADDGSSRNTMTWVNRTNPYCSGDIADPAGGG